MSRRYQRSRRRLKKLRFYCRFAKSSVVMKMGSRATLRREPLAAIQIFSQNSSSIIDDFSKDFRDGYLQILSQRHSRTKIDANKVYQEYIANKHHVHMNSTIWTSFSEFVKMLGREIIVGWRRLLMGGILNTSIAIQR